MARLIDCYADLDQPQEQGLGQDGQNDKGREQVNHPDADAGKRH